jgi:hypothetical protein
MARLALALSLGLALLAAGPARADLPPGNLLVDPGGEAELSGIPPWSGNATVVRYGAPGGFPSQQQGDALGGGNWFFAGGPNVASSKRTQSIQIPADAWPDIDANKAIVTIGGCLGGYGAQDDSVDIDVDLFGGGDRPAPTGDAVVNGPRAADRGNQTALLPRAVSVPVQSTTRVIDVALNFNRASGPGTYNDGYADNLLVALTPVGAPAPAPSCSVPGTGGGANPGSGTPGGGNPGPGMPGSGGGGTIPSAPFLVKTGATSARLSGSGAKIGVPLKCDGHDSPCTGSVSLTVPSLPHASSVKLGSASFSIAPGATKTVQVRLGRSARTRLDALSSRRLKRLRVTANVALGSVRSSFTMRLKS